MNAIINKAEKKAISALIKEIRRREAYRTLDNPCSKRLLKLWFIKESWRRVNELTAKSAVHDLIPLDLHSMTSAFVCMCNGRCQVKDTSAWIEIKLLNHSYWISCSEQCLYVTAGNMDTFPIRMSADRLVRMVEAFDAYLGKDDSEIEQVFERALVEYHAQKKCEEILKMTARNLIKDLIDEDKMMFEVRQQRNGRLCFTINRRASWLPDVVFRTTFETLRDDFAKAYKKSKASMTSRCQL